MKTLFSELYNKFLEIFQIEKSENTSADATNRLKVILMHDRTKLDPLIMSKMREELIEVFSKYVVINKEELEIDLGNNGDAAALMLNIPIIRAKTEEELEELRKKLREEEEKVEDSDDEEDENEEVTEDIVEGEVTSVEVVDATEEAADEDEIVEEDEDKE
ncbi:MAG: cell division topological specificity factor MinE [Candidatus Gastranaerophilales bacterium]|nr:cell division topological specificity factor MinE [Candidatus Gastranaerophilales bacterium]